MNTDKQKYEREIEEILARYEREKEPGRKKRDSVSTPVRGVITPRINPGPGYKRPALPGSFNWKRLSSGQYIAAAFGVALLAMFARPVPALASILVLVAVVLFFIPIFLYWSAGTTSGGWSTREEKRWRGQVIDFNTRREITDDPLAGIKRWFRRRR
jgi:hypothetical protein